MSFKAAVIGIDLPLFSYACLKSDAFGGCLYYPWRGRLGNPAPIALLSLNELAAARSNEGILRLPAFLLIDASGESSLPLPVKSSVFLFTFGRPIKIPF